LKILIISDVFGENALAQGICCREIAYELRDRGHQVHILQTKTSAKEPDNQEIEGFAVHKILGDWHSRLGIAFARHGRSWRGMVAYVLFRLLAIRTLLLLPWYPSRSPLLHFRLARAARRLHKQIGFDMVFSCYWPLAPLYAGESLKKQNVFFVSYYTDCMTNRVKGRLFISKGFKYKKSLKCEQRFFSASDLVLNLKCFEEHFQSEAYSSLRHKMQITDTPFLKERAQTQQGEQHNLVYTGSIRPSTLASMLNILSGVQGICANFYSPNCIILPQEDFIIKHGHVDRKRALAAQDGAGCLISMGDSGSSSIAAKIFEYISTGKKIIHFYTDDFDPNLPYYKKYKNSLLINLNNDTQANTNEISEFLKQPTQIIPWSELEELFPMNKAAYTANLILDAAEKSKN